MKGGCVAWSKWDTFVSSFPSAQEVADVGGLSLASSSSSDSVPEVCIRRVCVRALCLACRCNQEQGRQQAPSPGTRSPSSQPGPELATTQEEIQEAPVVLQLWGNMEVLFLDTWPEFGQHVSALTKAIAKRPYVRRLESPFCTAGAWASAVRAEEDGTGLRQVWKRQIQQFNRVSPAAAAAIAEAYPSPSLLLQACEECSTEDEKR